MLHVDHGKVPKVFPSWLRKYKLCSTIQIGALCRADELERYFSAAQIKEGMVISIADQTLITTFVSACINMKDMADIPESPK